MKRAAIYARCSTDKQDTGMQLADLKQYAQNRFEIVEEFVDNGKSGTNESRPRLNELMDKARKRMFDVVLVWRFDRFARSTKHLINALYEFKSLKIDFISYQENIDTSSPMGEAMFTIISAISKLERDIIAERVISGLRNAKANGKELGRPKIDVEIDKIQELRKQGLSIRKIAEVLKVSVGYVASRCSKKVSEISALKTA